jgi:hypothetical protein
MTYEDLHVSDNESESDNDNDNDAESTVESVADSTASAKRISRRQYQKALKLADPDYYVTNRRSGSRMKDVELYSTRCNPGRLIRNPITGCRTNDRVGTLAERKYFRVRMTTVGDGIDPVTLYYDSPQTYEKHMHTTVSKDIKKEWRSRSIKI